MPEPEFTLSQDGAAFIIGLESADGTNRLTRAEITSLADEVENICTAGLPALSLIFAGNDRYFSAGADLNEIAQLTRSAAYDFALTGQRLMNSIDSYPAPTIAAINGYCMGGGFDLALACDFRICS